MDTLYDEIYSRNIGVLSKLEQDKLKHSTISIAGLGGVGGLLTERLIRMGIGNLNITDPGTFEKSNFNRQFAASTASLGHNKAEIIFDQIKDINPYAKINYSTTGIRNESDAIEFANNTDLVIDEMDFGLFKQSIYLQRAARKRGIYYLFTSAIGFGAMIVIFAPNGITLEEYDGLLPDIDLASVKEINVPLDRVIPTLPSYTPAETISLLYDIYNGKKAVPTTSIGVGMASILAANEAVNIILHKRQIPIAPQYVYIDLLDQQFTTRK